MQGGRYFGFKYQNENSSSDYFVRRAKSKQIFAFSLSSLDAILK